MTAQQCRACDSTAAVALVAGRAFLSCPVHVAEVLAALTTDGLICEGQPVEITAIFDATRA